MSAPAKYLRWGERATDEEEAEIARLEDEVVTRWRAGKRIKSQLAQLHELVGQLHWAERKHRYISGENCPHCGARRVGISLATCYGSLSLHCDNCSYCFRDTPEGRWAMQKFKGTSACRKVVGQFAQEHPRNARILKRVLGRFA